MYADILTCCPFSHFSVTMNPCQGLYCLENPGKVIEIESVEVMEMFNNDLNLDESS